MKTLKVLLLLLITCKVNCRKSETYLVASAISGTLTEYFEPRESKVDLYFYGNNSEAIAEAILRMKSTGVSVTINKPTLDDSLRFKKRVSSISIFDSKEQFQEISEILFWVHDPNRRYEQLVYVQDFESSDIIRCSPTQPSWLVNINFLIMTSKSIDLVTTFMNTPLECWKLQPTTINRFSKNKQQWNNSVFYPNHFQSFHGCSIVMKQSSMSDQLTSFFLKDMGGILNFKITQHHAKYEIDAVVVYLDHGANSGYSTSAVIFSDTTVLWIPAGEPYTKIVKSFMMFEDEVWIAIALTFVIILTAILIINRMPRKVQNFAYGLNIRTPTLNIFQIFFNGGQNRVPGRNFARFILMLFVVWSLVIRTCYQSKLYEILQLDLRKPRFETIDQLIENNFTLAVYEDVNNVTRATEEELKKFINVTTFSDDEFAEMLVKVADPSKKMTMRFEIQNFKSYLTHLKLENLPIYQLKETISLSLGGMVFSKFCPYFERFNEIIGQMNANGMSKKNLNDYYKNSDRKPEEIGPQVLSMDHLGIPFLIILMFLSLSCLVFIMELIVHKIHKR